MYNNIYIENDIPTQAVLQEFKLYRKDLPTIYYTPIKEVFTELYSILIKDILEYKGEQYLPKCSFIDLDKLSIRIPHITNPNKYLELVSGFSIINSFVYNNDLLNFNIPIIQDLSVVPFTTIIDSPIIEERIIIYKLISYLCHRDFSNPQVSYLYSLNKFPIATDKNNNILNAPVNPYKLLKCTDYINKKYKIRFNDFLLGGHKYEDTLEYKRFKDLENKYMLEPRLVYKIYDEEFIKNNMLKLLIFSYNCFYQQLSLTNLDKFIYTLPTRNGSTFVI